MNNTSAIEQANFEVMNLVAKEERRYKKLTRQQEKYVLARLRGVTRAQSNEIAGFSPKYLVENAHKNVAQAIEFHREKDRERNQVSRDRLTNMLFDSHAKAQEVRDEIAAVREIGKMHGVYESDVQKRAVTVNGNINVTQNKLEIMTDQQLMEQAGLQLESLEPGE